MIPRTLLITGASSGIGRALALEYARRGAHVAVTARRTAELEQLVAEIEGQGGKAFALTADVADPAQATDVVRRAEERLGSLDMVIANAGVSALRHVSTMEGSEVQHLLKVNVLGAIATLHAAVPIMLAQQCGHLVGVSSLAGRRGLPYSAAYCASKAALSTFLESLRIELRPAGLRVSDVQPGFVETAMTRGARHPMPLQWTADKAARVIVRRLERAPAIVSFPWALDKLSALGRLLPPAIYDRAVRLLPVTSPPSRVSPPNGEAP